MENKYKESMLTWLNHFSQEVIKSNFPKSEEEEFIGIAEEMSSKLLQRGAFDPSYLYQIEKEAEELYSRYLRGSSPTDQRGDEHNPKGVPIGGHKLPKLSYSYDALEPHIIARIMELHHKQHHQSYVDGLNKAEKELEKQRKSGKFEEIKHWERELAFNGAGHYLHTLFWEVMSPNGGGKASGQLATQIDENFGGFDAFKAQFTEAAKKVEGSGWTILVWASRAGKLEILTAEKHQNLSQWDVIPLLPLDVWEHAYYLQYENEREKYINNWWNVVNWSFVEKRFKKAKSILWLPTH